MMTAARQQLEGGRLAGLSLAQKAACLARLNREEEMAVLVEASRGTPAEEAVRFQYAVALAGQRHYQQALVQARRAIELNNNNMPARRLAYRMIRASAAALIHENPSGLAELLEEAVLIAPPEESPERDFARFDNILAIAQIRGGQRPDAIRTWVDRLKQTPSQVETLHHLALLHHFGAHSASAPDQVSLWRGAIAFWTVLVHHDPFWSAWRAERSSLWAAAFAEDAMHDVRARVLEEFVERPLSTQATAFRQQQQEAQAGLFDDLYFHALAEKKAAETWKRIMPNGKPPDSLLLYSGGPLFFERVGMDSDAWRLIQQKQTALEKSGKPEELDSLFTLALSYGPARLGPVAAQIDAHRPADALRALKQKSPEASILRARAKLSLAMQTFADSAVRAIDSMMEAKKELPSGGSRLVQHAAAQVNASICAAAVELVTKEVTRLKNESNFDLAIGLLEKAQPLDQGNQLRDLLCITLCDRAEVALTKKDWRATRKDLEAALNIVPGHQRATQRLATSYNNEGCETNDPDRAQALFEKALQLEPDNLRFRQNMADSLASGAMKIIDTLKYSYGDWDRREKINKATTLLEKAAKLLNPKLDLNNPMTRLAIMALAENDAALAAEPELYRAVLRLLGMIYKARGY